MWCIAALTGVSVLENRDSKNTRRKIYVRLVPLKHTSTTLFLGCLSPMTSSFRGYDQFRNSLFLGTKGRGGKGREGKKKEGVWRVTALLALLALVISYLGGVTEGFILLLL